MTQLSFLEPIAPPLLHNRTPTSRAAAESMQAHAPSQEAVVLEFIRSQSAGVTREEIAEATGLRLASVCGRVASLCKKRLVEGRSVRKASSGRAAEVLTATRGR